MQEVHTGPDGSIGVKGTVYEVGSILSVLPELRGSIKISILWRQAPLFTELSHCSHFLSIFKILCILNEVTRLH